MPLFGTFSSASSRALGLRNGSPPLPPTISAPSDNVSASLSGSGNTTNRINTTVSFASTVTSFAIARFEFKVDQLDSSDNIVVEGTYQTAASAGATSFLLSNLLTSTRYGLYMRTVDVAGLVSVPTSRIRFITAAEVAPTVPARTLSSTALSVTIAYAAGTAGTYPIGTREFSLHPTTGGTTTYVPFTETVTRTTRTDGGAALVPGTSYTVSFRYTAVSPGVGTSTASSTISTAGETAPGAPGATLSITGTTTATVSRGTSTAGTYPISNYQFRVYEGTTPSGAWIAMPNTTAAVTGLAVDTGHRVQVKAVAATSGAETISTSATATTNPGTPAAPTDLAFSGMTTSSTSTVALTFSKPTYASSGFVVVSSSTGGATGTGTFAATLSGSTFSVSIGSQSYNATYTYKAYVRTRLFADGVTFADSNVANSNTKTWVTPKKNVAKVWKGSDFGQTYYADYTYVTETNACEPYRLAITFPSSGIGATENDVGYQRVDLITALMRCGNQLTRPSDGANFQFPTTTANKTALCNITDLRFSYATIGSESSANGAKPTIYTGHTNLGTSAEELVYRYVSVGGTSLHNKVFMVTVEPGSGFKSWNSGCVLSLKGDYFSGKKIELTGVETTGGSFS